MIALILGGAPSWGPEAAEAAALLNRRHLVVAANMAGIHWAGRLDGWASLHPEALPTWRAERAGPAAARHFVPAGVHANPGAEQVPDRWNGSSGLYAAQVALFELGATAVILCGVPMDSEAGHFVNPGAWAGTADYRLGFEGALRECGGRIRSMGGWTADLFGPPTAAWAASVENIKPLGASTPQHLRIIDMQKVTNTGKTTETFWAPDEKGDRVLFRVAPNESVTADIDPEQPRFKSGVLKIEAITPAGASEPASEAAPAAREPIPGHRPLKAKPEGDA